MFKRTLCLLLLVAGLLGLIVCIAMVLGVWRVKERVVVATENTFRVADELVVDVQARIEESRGRLAGLKTTTSGIEEIVKDWAMLEARQRLRLRLGVEEKADFLAAKLRQTDHWLEFAESSLLLIQRAWVDAKSLGARLPVLPDGRLLENLAAVRTLLAGAVERVESIAAGTAEAGEWSEAQWNRVSQAVARVFATLTSIDARLEQSVAQLEQLRGTTDAARVTVRQWTAKATLVVMLTLAWIATGQAAMCYLGRKGIRKKAAEGPAIF